MTVPRSGTVLRLCARQELALALRSRWIQIFAAAFAAMSLAVAASGYILSGGSGVQDFSRTAASLVQLVILLVPIAALLLGVLSLASDRGTAELLYSQPVRRPVILLGRVAGLFQALVAALAAGFGAAGLVIYSQSGSEGLAGFLFVFAAAVVLTAVCLALAAFIATDNVGRRRSRALAVALVVWFVLVVVFDLVALGVASTLRSGHASRLLITTVLINPVDAIRTGALLGIDGTAAFGAASLAFLRFTGGLTRAYLLIGASAVAWIAAPLAAAAWRLTRTDI